jgi:putative Mn2+ efflux pump MntP
MRSYTWAFSFAITQREAWTMGIMELFLVAVGLSMDAFAVSVCKGLSIPRADAKDALTVGLYFGVFQALMPLIGYFVGVQFADSIAAFDHWVAFLLLGLIGGKMIKESLSDRCPATSGNSSLLPRDMLPLAVATSIDALAVGVSFAFLSVRIVPAVSLIGVTTLVLSMLGVALGKGVGARFKAKAELAGGILLILMGVKILLEHLGVLA